MHSSIFVSRQGLSILGNGGSQVHTILSLTHSLILLSIEIKKSLSTFFPIFIVIKIMGKGVRNAAYDHHLLL